VRKLSKIGNAKKKSTFYYYYYYLDKLTNMMSQLQVNQIKDKVKTKKKETKRSNHQTGNQQNYSNPYQATSILFQVSNERVKIAPFNSIDATTKYVHHILNVLITIDHYPDDRRREFSICTSGRKKESVFRATSWTIYLKSNWRQQI
jgi:hypothetical protein